MDQQEVISVLVAEDDFLVHEVIRGLLERMGYTVIGEVSDGQRAVEMANTLKPDVVLMDVDMPRLNGLEATEKIYEDNPVPVVVLTAYDTPEFVERASQVGVGAYLVKPPNARELERAISIAMARFKDGIELRRLNIQLEARNQELQEALTQIKVLQGLLPICASCRKIRDNQDEWHQLESYIRDHSEVEFSHGICPECVQLLYPDILPTSSEAMGSTTSHKNL